MFWKSGNKVDFVAEQPLPDTPWPVTARVLMSEREKTLYQDLSALYPDHKVFVQVALSQLVDVARDHPERMAIRARFKQLVADFVLCRTDLSIVAVIELDDRTHLRADRKRADVRKSKALADAGIRLVRVPAGAIPPLGKLKALIEGGKGPDIGTVGAYELRLAETVRTFASNGSSDEGGPFGARMSRKQKQASWRIGTAIVFAVFGWFAYTTFLPHVVTRALASLSPKPVTRHSLANSTIKPVDVPGRIPVVPLAAATTMTDSSVERPASPSTIVELKKQKKHDWAAFYTAPSSCEHPASWSDQVECGNQYMRAKKRFEQQWVASHPSDLAEMPFVLDNSTIRTSAAQSRKIGP